jgi:adenylylsulfate kinase-like enzyme
MIVISDGDLIRNQLDKNLQPVELGYDQRSETYMTTRFHAELCHLLDDTGLINIEQSGLAFIRQRKGFANYGKTQVITIGLPLLILVLFGVVFTYLRKENTVSRC